jgi:hypothetical protein
MKKGLDPKAFGLAAGIMWGAMMLIMTVLAIYTGYGAGLMTAISKLYPGYTVSFGGAIIGTVFGFIDAFVGCYIFAWLYNKLLK